MAGERAAYEIAGVEGESQGFSATRFVRTDGVRGLGNITNMENMNLRLNLTPPADDDYGDEVSVSPVGHVADSRPMTSSPGGGSPSASSPIFLGSPTSPSNGELSPVVLRPGESKIDVIKKWGLSTYKCTKQLLSEKLGKTSRTVDAELEPQIELLRDTHRRYLNILRLAKAMAAHFLSMVQTQHALGEAFADLAQKSPELQEEFMYNADTQRNLTKNGDTLLGALNFFISSLSTLCNKTIEDSLMTIRDYEAARVEFDAYRSDVERLTQEPKSDANFAKLQESQRLYEAHRLKYEKLRGDVTVKLKFLHENRVKVMHKQLLLFHNSISAYFSGNQSALESTLKQFNIKLQSPNAGVPSWLEK